ncbi:MAG: NTP transferase domain-containing protein, partial [Anaerolineaceae bacterium]
MVITPVILAAGHGTRMKSTLPKVMHSLAGKPLIHYCIEAVQQDDFEKAIVVVGHGAEMVRQTLGERVRFVEQEQQLGTGHAVMVTEPLLAEKTDLIVVTTGDMPLLLPET